MTSIAGHPNHNLLVENVLWNPTGNKLDLLRHEHLEEILNYNTFTFRNRTLLSHAETN